MDKTFASSRVRWARPRAASALAAVLFALLAPTAAVLAQEGAETPTPRSEVPSSGAARSGPVRAASPRAGGGTPAETDIAVGAAEKPAGVSPVAIQIERFGIDGPIERADIVDGSMENPSGSFVVAWYHQLATLGQGENVVLSGHVDYWDADQAIFWNLDDPGLEEGDTIKVWGENDEVFEYEVDWSRLYDVAELTTEVIQGEITGDTDKESLTLITCGGDFNYDTDEYLYRVVVRATKV